MATVGEWMAGARPRTLPAAIAPVAVGTGVAVGAGQPVWWKAALCLLLALLLQIGVNYSNDYSDGVRGTDARRVGPVRLTATRLARPRHVLAAALGCFAAAAATGLVLAATSSLWLVLVGALAIVAAWFYTGGSRPYGYRALGELSVFVFFGLVAVVGTAYIQLLAAPWTAWAAAVPVGLVAVALLVVNNLRDIPSDTEAGKRTLAVVLGDRATRLLYAGAVAGAFAVALLTLAASWWVALVLLAVPLAVAPVRTVLGGATGPALIPPLAATGRLQLVMSLLYAVGLALG
ncbi:1,4-dihydroxy-2-naphthoate polyprenyltransferase [Allonocardiopsis opalescens]|uniref:1,4-dihydroxy-2-naphthoate octaprenyltransferase n=1 Tax=Allonocardiopsis opalescens TaxID=1144618 RepID=A0A2T0QFF7_9ACTN|nr:1,4-dihydroxy-2-naphthoate polyprenyltransferase [Allonocardiopsis opalescens]PRY02620.1 1,4-dihydroxy-2-naphthoate prenyltransferase [Allonocardiopsis opalescens]